VFFPSLLKHSNSAGKRESHQEAERKDERKDDEHFQDKIESDQAFAEERDEKDISRNEQRAKKKNSLQIFF